MVVPGGHRQAEQRLQQPVDVSCLEQVHPARDQRDRVGRVRAMMASVLAYSLFTGACYFATEPWHVFALRAFQGKLFKKGRRPDIEIVLNLTIPAAHVAVGLAIRTVGDALTS